MPMLACGRYECDTQEMVELMGGHHPPSSGVSRDGYFTMFENMVREKYGEYSLSCIQLLGCGPDEYDKWYNP